MLEQIIDKGLYQQNGGNGIGRSVFEAEYGDVTQVVDLYAKGGHIFSVVIDMDI
jgi:hypothetical protein